MTPFYGPGGRRATPDEIARHVAHVVGAIPVVGLAEMLDAGGSVPGGERISGYASTVDLREWLLRLDASAGMAWRTAPIPADAGDRVAFVLSVGFGNGSPLPQPSGAWDLYVGDRLAVSVRMVNHSQVWRQGACAFTFSANRIESAPPGCGMTISSVIRDEAVAAFGPAFLVVPRAWVAPGQSATIRAVPRCPVASRRWFQVRTSGTTLQMSDISELLAMLAGPAHPTAGGLDVFFGDIHTHSGQMADRADDTGCGRGSRRESYEFARGPAALDFYALTDHEVQVGPHEIGDYLGLADEYSDEGRFACLPAFEYTNLLYGHRNVYFRESGGTVFNADIHGGWPTLDPARTNTPADLWAAMERTGVPFITVPHHASAASHPLNLDFHDPRYDRLYEVYSTWGSSEYYGDFPRGMADRWRSGDFRDALRRGQRYGVIASSDGHDGHPGDAQSPLLKHHHIFHACGSGRAAVLAENLTRGDVWDALHARRCYGTTGPPIVLDVRLGDALMGSEVPHLDPGARPRLRVACTGTNGIDHVRIVRNARVAETVPCHGERDCDIEWEDDRYARGEPASYYVRVVQVDRESAWSSPIWVG